MTGVILNTPTPRYDFTAARDLCDLDSLHRKHIRPPKLTWNDSEHIWVSRVQSCLARPAGTGYYYYAALTTRQEHLSARGPFIAV